MTEQDGGALAALEKELQRFHSQVYEEFRKAEKQIQGKLTREEVVQWVREGVGIAQSAFRSWEAAADYFKFTPQVLDKLYFSHFVHWSRWGRMLAQESPVLASAYFKATPGVLLCYQPSQLGDWAAMGKHLYKGTWKSNSLSARFFEVSPGILRYLSLKELEVFVAFIDALGLKSYDLAVECLNLSEHVLPRLEREDRRPLLAFATSLVETNWRDARTCFEAASKVMARLDRGERRRFLSMANKLGTLKGGNSVAFLLDGSRALGDLEWNQHGQTLDLAETLFPDYPQAVTEFLRSSPAVLKRIRKQDLALWFQEGLNILKENEEGGMAFFRLESSKGEAILENLSAAVELGSVKEVLRMYCRALGGISIQILPTDDLTKKGIGWTSAEKSATDGTAVFLPAMSERHQSKRENFEWLKVIATHQVGHLEFGSFNFTFSNRASLFTDLRPLLQSAASSDNPPVTDLQRFFDLFPERRLASDIFNIVEDGRIDYQVKQEYPGIRSGYIRVQQDALKERPEPESLALREALVELLVRVSLEQPDRLSLPQELVEPAALLYTLAQRVQQDCATVEDSAEATLRIYHVLSQVPNREASQEQGDAQEMQGQQQLSSTAQMEQSLEQMLSSLGALPTSGEPKDGERPYRSPKEVGYRGEFKPELVQLMMNLRKDQSQKGSGGAESTQITPEAVQELLEKSAELDVLDGADLSMEAALFAQNLMKEVARQQPQQDTQGQSQETSTSQDNGQPLNADEPLTFLYHEWDFRAVDFKPRWCIVRERKMEEGDLHFFDTTLKDHSLLCTQIKRHFELISPEMLHRVKRLEDGEEFELDALVESVIERKAGASPSEKVYWRRNKVARDVAVAFLLDMSASTAEALDEVKRSMDNWDPPDDPRDYLLWLRARREDSLNRRAYKRIIDIEKESLVLLIKALETIGDAYGIYGFSGYGRENVEFFVIKDLDENFSDRIRRRIDKIAPLHATRMGPALRHVTSKLEARDAKTKVLFLLSDGRPQDRGYSREGVEKEYAVHDTHMALVEAKRKNIVPFCLTIDKAGHDYLKTMCQDIGYEVLGEVEALPKRLPMLYRRLTV